MDRDDDDENDDYVDIVLVGLMLSFSIGFLMFLFVKDEWTSPHFLLPSLSLAVHYAHGELEIFQGLTFILFRCQGLMNMSYNGHENTPQMLSQVSSVIGAVVLPAFSRL